MTDRKNASLAEKSEKRRQRYEARRKLEKKLGRKLRPGEQADHVKPKKGKAKYNNGDSNLRVKSKSAHKKVAKSQGLTGGRPKGGAYKRGKK